MGKSIFISLIAFVSIYPNMSFAAQKKRSPSAQTSVQANSAKSTEAEDAANCRLVGAELRTATTTNWSYCRCSDGKSFSIAEARTYTQKCDEVDSGRASLGKTCEQMGAVTIRERHGGNNCACSDGSIFSLEAMNQGATCPVAKATQATQVTTGQPELQNLENCLNELKQTAFSCSEKSTAARARCDEQDRSNKEVDQAKSAVSQTMQLMQSLKMGSGAAKECLTAGAAALASKSAMDLMKEDCEVKTEDCTNSCVQSEFTNKLQKCYQIRSSVTPPSLAEQASSLYEQVAAEAARNVEAGVSTCQTAKTKKAEVNNLMRDLQNTINSGMMCACQFSMGGSNCAATSSNFGPVLAVCAVGTINYNAQACQCQMTGNADPSCKNLKPLAATPAGGFSGPSLKQNAPGGEGLSFGNGGGSGINIGPIDDDLSPDAQKDKEGNKGIAGFNTPGGGGYGGIGGGGGDAAGISGDPAHYDEPEGKDLGLMNQVKTAIGSLFGGSKPNAGKNNYGPGGRTRGEKVDFNKMRPAYRGVASCDQSQIGCANGTTIWQRVNRCMGNSRENSTCNISFLGPK